MSQQKDSKQVVLEIEKLVKSIQDYDATSGRPEDEWRKDQQELLRLLSENPLEIYRLTCDLKEKIKKIVDNYLEWSFCGWW